MTEKAKSKLLAVYNAFIIVLALISIVLVILDLCGKIDISTGTLYWTDTSILIIFAVDYFVRLIKAEKKGAFFRKNIFDLLAIIPFNSIFAFFRFARIFRLAKLTKLTKLSKLAKITKFARLTALFGRFGNRATKFLHTNGFIYMLYTAGVLILSSSVLMMFFEKKTFTDALWWSVVTVTTVGYGDISPETGAGRVMAVILMMFGIGLISMLTGTITSFFANSAEEKKKPAVMIDGIELTDEQQEKVKEYALQLTAKEE